MSSGGPRPDDAAVSHSIALVLKACSCVELTCQLGNTAARSTVRYLAKRHHEAGNSMVKAVTGQLLAKSISLSRLVRGVSDELGSMIWWPRMGAELYEALKAEKTERSLSKLPSTTVGLVECPSMLSQIQFTIGPPGPEQWIFYINKQPLFRLELFSIQRPLLTCYAYGQAVCSNQQPVNAAPSRALCLKESKEKIAVLTIHITSFTDAHMMLLTYAHLSFQTGDYALWAAVVTGTKLGLLQLDSVLLDVIRTLNPSTYRYTSTAQSVLDWFQSKDRLQRAVKQLLTSRQEARAAAANRMQGSREEGSTMRAADMQDAQAFRSRTEVTLAELRFNLQQAIADATQERERWSREAAALETRSLAAEKLAADRLPALQQAAHLQASLHAAHTAKAEALDGQARAREEAKAAQEAGHKAEAYSAKLKAMLEKALRKEEASRLRSKAHQDAAQAEIAAAKAEASGAKAEVAAAEGKAATFASRLQELQDSADVASLENKKLAQEVARLELSLANSQMHPKVQAPFRKDWADADPAMQDLAAHQLRSSMPPSPQSPLQCCFPTPQVGYSDGSSSPSSRSPTGSDDSTLSCRQVQVAQQQQQQQQQEMHQLAGRLEDALQREQKLKESLCAMQCQSRHTDVIPVTPLDCGWVVGRQLGRGNNANVLAASNVCLADVVLKKGNKIFLAEEARKLWRVPHPNLVQLFCMVSTPELDPTDGAPQVCLALERLGPDLGSLLESKHTFTVREQVELLQQVASALAKLHSCGVVHQDLHSGNVLQSLDGLHYKLSDLGSAAYHEIDDQPNILQYSLCAVGLESPQLAADMLLDGEYQPLFGSDVWALGQLALTLVVGSQPPEHVRLQNTQEYLHELEQGTHDLTRSPGHKACATYLMDLAADVPPPDYADEVTFAPLPKGREAGAAAALQAVIRGCLHSYLEKRLLAAQVAVKLFDIMVRNGWTEHASMTSKRNRRKS